MHCEELTDDVLLDVAERRATVPTLDAVDFHLGQCRPCTDRYLETAHIAKIAGLALRETPTRDLDQRILGELDEILVPRKVSKRRWIMPSVAVAACLGFAFLATFVVLASQPKPDLYVQLMKDDPEPPAPVPPPVAAAPSVVETIKVEIDAPVESPLPAPDPVPIATVQFTPLIPDMNGDQRIDVADVMILMESLNEQSPIALYDLNGDKKVDVADKMLLLHLDPK